MKMRRDNEMHSPKSKIANAHKHRGYAGRIGLVGYGARDWIMKKRHQQEQAILKYICMAFWRRCLELFCPFYTSGEKGQCRHHPRAFFTSMQRVSYQLASFDFQTVETTSGASTQRRT